MNLDRSKEPTMEQSLRAVEEAIQTTPKQLAGNSSGADVAQLLDDVRHIMEDAKAQIEWKVEEIRRRLALIQKAIGT